MRKKGSSYEEGNIPTEGALKITVKATDYRPEVVVYIPRSKISKRWLNGERPGLKKLNKQ